MTEKHNKIKLLLDSNLKHKNFKIYIHIYTGIHIYVCYIKQK